jgi:serine/threonine protein kinase
MAEIFKAKTHGAHGFEKTLVIKKILPELAQDPSFLRMFIDEARVMVQLEHPKVVQVLDFGEVEGEYYIAMEYVPGTDALALLRDCARHRCRPTTGIAVHIVADVLDALDYAHTLADPQGEPLGIIHRDISPSNIFVSDLGEVKLGDFGIARVDIRRQSAEGGALRGKYGYMSPEMVNGEEVDHRSDIFSVGVVLAELLLVRRLFIAKSELEVLLQVRDARLDRLEEFGAHIHPQLRKILQSALARDPSTRYQDAATFRDALHRFLYDHKRMIHSTDVRQFLRKLRHLDEGAELDPATATTALSEGSYLAPYDEETDKHRKGTGDQVTAMARALAAQPPVSWDQKKTAQAPAIAELARLTAELDLPSDEDTPSFLLKKRKILLGPPPKPAPIPEGLAETGQHSSINSSDALAAVTELKESGSTAQREFGTSDQNPAVHPPTLEKKRATPMEASKVAASRMYRPIGGVATMPTPDLQGELSERSPLRLLFTLAVAEEVGLLVLQQGPTIKEVYLVDGDPQYVASNQPEELFGQYLVQRGIISKGELSMALAMLPYFDGKVGDALVALKLLRPVQVLRHLTHQVRQKLIDAFGWLEGTYAYYRGKTIEHESAPLGLDAFEVMGTAILQLPASVLEQRLQPTLSRRPRPVRPVPAPPEVFRLGSRPGEVYEGMTGRLTLAELIGRYDDLEQRESFIRMVYLLAETGLVDFD